MKVSIVTPTLNIMRSLDEYINAVAMQKFPHEDIEIIIADGGSTDGTIEKLLQYKEKCDLKINIYDNPLKTAEAGKAVGVRMAEGDIVCLLDSDNILPNDSWLSQMMVPFKDEDIVATEPIEFWARKQDGLINRYTAMLGMGDPLCLFLGNYDRYCAVTGKWTEVKHYEEDKGDYLSIRFDDTMPTIGANGFCMRRQQLIDNFDGEYLFDIDVLWELFQKDSSIKIAKVKTGIIHLFSPTVKTFYKKQNRRIKDFLYFSEAKGRKYPWKNTSKMGIVLFCLSCITIVPLLIQSIIGVFRRGDAVAWIMHPIACWITLWIYGTETIVGMFKKEAANRDEWKQ